MTKNDMIYVSIMQMINDAIIIKYDIFFANEMIKIYVSNKKLAQIYHALISYLGAVTLNQETFHKPRRKLK